MSAAGGGAISYVCIARADSKQVVASWSGTHASEFRESVRKVLEAPDFSVKAVPGKRFKLDGGFNTVWFITDNARVVWLAITNKGYPERTLFGMLEDLQQEVAQTQYADRLAMGSEGGYTKSLKKILMGKAREYADPANKDDLKRVMAQVDEVKFKMQENFDIVLKNLETSEQIVESSGEFGEREEGGRDRE